MVNQKTVSSQDSAMIKAIAEETGIWSGFVLKMESNGFIKHYTLILDYINRFNIKVNVSFIIP